MLTNFWEEQQYPPKVILMAEAIIELLSEGKEINSLKVSEITKRAGIGKGTAYEYFTDKEEMIVTALEYNLGMLIQKLVEREKDAVDFRDMLVRVVEWMTDYYKNNAGFMILFKMTHISHETPGEIMARVHLRCAGKKEAVGNMIKEVLKVGEVEGTIKKLHPYYGVTAIISQIMAYSLYLSDEDLKREISEQEAKDAVVENIIKLLN